MEIYALVRDRGQGPEAISQVGQMPTVSSASVPALMTWAAPTPICLHHHQAPMHRTGVVKSDSVHLRLRPREGKRLSWGHTASRLQNQDLHPCPLIRPHLENSQLMQAACSEERTDSRLAMPLLCAPASGEPAAPLAGPGILSNYYMPGVCIMSCLEAEVSHSHVRGGISEAQRGAVTCP